MALTYVNHTKPLAYLSPCISNTHKCLPLFPSTPRKLNPSQYPHGVMSMNHATVEKAYKTRRYWCIKSNWFSYRKVWGQDEEFNATVSIRLTKSPIRLQPHQPDHSSEEEREELHVSISNSRVKFQQYFPVADCPFPAMPLHYLIRYKNRHTVQPQAQHDK